MPVSADFTSVENADVCSFDELRLPLVSVIVVNYNYGAHLMNTIETVLAQSYPNVEVIIVDDMSDDDSKQIIEAIRSEHSDVRFIALPQNVGQSAASLSGLNESSGSYVLFLDADDQLLPRCIEAHIYAHLSSRIAVAFTSVDVINHVAGQDVSLSHAGFSNFVGSGRGRHLSSVRCLTKSMPKSWYGLRAAPLEAHQLHFVMPPHADPWVWSPTSANCYRRDAVEILLCGTGLETLRLATDTYLARPLSALFGSILIDLPLIRYVKHNTNNFVQGVPLHNTLFFDPEPEKMHSIAATRFAVKRLMACVGTGSFRYEDPQVFFKAMAALVESWPGIPPEGGTRSFYIEQLKANRASLAAAFGSDHVDFEMKDFFRRSKKAR